MTLKYRTFRKCESMLSSERENETVRENERDACMCVRDRTKEIDRSMHVSVCVG